MTVRDSALLRLSAVATSDSISVGLASFSKMHLLTLEIGALAVISAN